jgi:WD40 repeat protein
MGQALTHRPFADALQEGSLILGPMNRDELQAAVEKPAELQGAAFEAGLVQRILDDVGEEPGNLPLLEFALTLLWERLDQGWLTHAAYEEIGRVDGALARYAEEVWAELDVTEREAARRLFVQLVQPGEGTEDTRRVARHGELAPGHWSLVQHLADQRLVVTGRDQAGDETVEVVHEALIRSWDRLRTWMQADRAFRTWQEGLRVAQRGWEASSRDEGALLRGAPLAMALEWAKEHEAQLSQPELAFIETSQAESQKRFAAEEARRQRELETAQQLAEVAQARAEEQTQAARRLRRRAFFLGGVLVVAALLALAAVLFARQSNQNAALAAEREAQALEESHQRATAEAEALKAQEQAQTEAQTRATAEVIAITERDNAEYQKDLTRSRELSLESAAILSEDPELSILLALEGLDNAYTKEAEQALHQGVLASRLHMHLVSETASTHGESVNDLDLSPDGSRIATADSSGYVNIWDASTGESLLVISRDGEHFRSLAYSPDGERLALASREVDITTTPLEDFSEQLDDAGTSKLALWDAHSGDVITELTLEGESAEGVTFSPDGERIAVATMSPDSRALRIFDSALAEELLVITFDLGGYDWTDRNFEPAFSPDGRWVAVGLGDGTARVLDATTGEELFSFIHTSDPWDQVLRGVAFDPQGRRLAVSGTDGMLSAWDLETGDQIFVVDIGSNIYTPFSPDGELIAASDKVLDSETGETVLTLPGPFIGYQAAFMPDGQRLVTDGIAHDVLVWDISPSAELWTTRVAAVGAGGNRLAMSPGGEYLASGDDSGWITLLDAASGEVLWDAQGHQDWVGGLSFSEDGTRLATGADDGRVVIWETQEGITLTQWTAHDAWVNDVELSPDGDRLATASNDQSIKMWDVSSGELLAIHDLPHNIPGMSMHPDGELLASTTQMDGTISLWDFETGESVGELLSPQWGILGTEFSPDGEVLFSATPAGTVIAWDVSNKEQLYVLDHGVPVMGLATSPDGKLLAVTAPWDDKLFLWDLDRTELLWQIPLPWIGRVAISPDGRTLYVSSIFADGLEDPVVRALTLDIDTLAAMAKSRLTRDFTADECRRYRIDPCPAEQ